MTLASSSSSSYFDFRFLLNKSHILHKYAIIKSAAEWHLIEILHSAIWSRKEEQRIFS